MFWEYNAGKGYCRVWTRPRHGFVRYLLRIAIHREDDFPWCWLLQASSIQPGRSSCAWVSQPIREQCGPLQESAFRRQSSAVSLTRLTCGWGLALRVQQHRKCRVLHKNYKNKETTKPEQTGKHTRKPKTKKKKKHKKTSNTEENPGFDLFCVYFHLVVFLCLFLVLFWFFWWFFQSVCFCGKYVFDSFFPHFLLKSTFSVPVGLISLAHVSPALHALEKTLFAGGSCHLPHTASY